MEQSIKSVLVKQSLAQQQPINNLQVTVANSDGVWENLISHKVFVALASIRNVGFQSVIDKHHHFLCADIKSFY